MGIVKWGLAGVALVLTAGVVLFAVARPGGNAQAQTAPDSPKDQYEQMLAAKLGISVEQLEAAQKAARDDLIQQAVASGRLTQEEADALKAKPPGEGRRLHRLGHGAAKVVGNIVDAAAQAIGISKDDVKSGLQSGQSLTDIANANGMDRDTLKTKMSDILTADIDKAEQDGKLTTEQADRLRQGMTERLEKVIDHKGGKAGNGELRQRFKNRGAPPANATPPAGNQN
jgi:uncharacterized protein YidB (DUF937 family)